MAEFKTVVAEWDRMCEFSIDCSACPLLEKQKGEGCRSWALRNPEEAEKIVIKWSKENPILTNRIKFKEVFGKDAFSICILPEPFLK